jgi:CheY-like chemotaxis protein
MAASPLAVLIVDDYADTVESLALILQGDGHDVRTARGGTEALALLFDWQPDVAILDLLMPEIDGIDLADRLCAELKRRPLLVAVSGSIRRDLWERTDKFDHHFFKPLDPGVLADVLNRYAVAGARRRSGTNSFP